MRTRRFLGRVVGGRPRRRSYRFIIPAVAVVVGVIVYLFAASDEPDRPTNSRRRIEQLDTPAWHESELNRPTVPGVAAVDPTETAPVTGTGDPLHVLGRVQRNQTLFVALRNQGIKPDRIQPVVDAMSTVFDFRRARPGDEYEGRLDLDGNVLEFRYQTSPEHIYLARLVGDEYVAETVDIPRRRALEFVKGSVQVSLFRGFTDIGEKSEVARSFMDLFAYDFDFGSDTQRGDTFRLLVEKVYLDGAFYKYGRIYAAEYISNELTLRAYYFDRKGDGDGEYFDEEGRSLRRMFLKTPVLNCKVTSVFTKRRFHPILKRYRPHYGVDWAGPTGTPIMAIADGTVTFLGWKGGNGNLLILKHDYGYESIYAHLHRFPRGLSKGDQVKQRQVVGYVGNTGISTGPHLHLGVKKNGTYLDPMLLDTSRGEQLTGKKHTRFMADKERLHGMLQGTLPIEPLEPEEPPTTDAPPSPKADPKK